MTILQGANLFGVSVSFLHLVQVPLAVITTGMEVPQPLLQPRPVNWKTLYNLSIKQGTDLVSTMDCMSEQLVSRRHLRCYRRTRRNSADTCTALASAVQPR